jgi:apolipoprotein N-acyltransferase
LSALTNDFHCKCIALPCGISNILITARTNADGWSAPDPNAPGWLPRWQVPAGRHDKAILVPWGEYTPAGDFLPFLKHGRDLVSSIPELTPGDWDQAPFVLGIGPPAKPGLENRPILAGTVICFELAFPARCRAWRRRPWW